jgi:hypothetical protein
MREQRQDTVKRDETKIILFMYIYSLITFMYRKRKGSKTPMIRGTARAAFPAAIPCASKIASYHGTVHCKYLSSRGAGEVLRNLFLKAKTTMKTYEKIRSQSPRFVEYLITALTWITTSYQ